MSNHLSFKFHSKFKIRNLKFLLYSSFLHLLTKLANALFASAILCISCFFLMAFPSFFEAERNSSASFLFIGAPFFFRAASIIQCAARKNFLAGRTSREIGRASCRERV